MTNSRIPNGVTIFSTAIIAISAFVALTGCAGKSKSETKPTTAAAPAKTNAYEAILKKAAAEPMASVEGDGWKPMFDGHSLAGWKETDFSGKGKVSCDAGLIVMDMGNSLTGVSWTNDAPKVNYEIALEAMKVDGSDFFCGLTFPVQDSWCSLILGGWGGTVVGLSSIDGQDASENETSQFIKFDAGRWYRIRLRVTTAKIQVWLDDKPIINLPLEGKNIALRFGEIELSKPLGIASYETASALRGMKIRRIDAASK
jgi:hypothetical protein